MTSLPKHLQPRWRYLAVHLETWPDAAVDREAFQRAVWSAARALVGDVGSAGLDLTVVRFEDGAGTPEAVVRTHRGEVDRARAVLGCVDAIDGDPVGLRVAGVSGTVRACEEKYIGRRPEGSNQRHVVFENAERRAAVRGERVDVCLDEAFAGVTILDI